jgi:GT2 family glycosyltransferase
LAIRHKGPNYLHWIKLNEPAVDELKLQKTCLFPYQPQINIVTTNNKISQKYYKEFLSSIQEQTYDKWKLCVADNDISKKTNEEIKLNADGDYIAFIDYHKTLAPFALYEIVKYINEHPDVEFLYSDEDSIVYGKRRNPVFKPDYAPDTLRSWNYIGNFVVMKRNLVDCLSRLKGENGDVQNYDLVLRATEATKKIHHIRKILCHNRPKKTLSGKSSSAGVIQSHIERLGLKGTVKPDEKHPERCNVIYDVIGNPSVSIIIPNKDYMTTLKTCVDSILERSTYANYEIVIVENNSENEETFTYYHKLEKQAKIRVLYYPEKGFNYSKLINFGVRNCSSDYIVQLNNDTEVITPNWLELMLGFAQRPDVGAVGVKLLFPNGYIQHAGIGGSFSEGLFHILSGNYIMNYTAVTGACLMSRTKLYNKVGYMDEEFPFDFGDVDFCFKLRAEGLLIVYNPLAELYHHESLTRGFHDTPEKLALSMKYRDAFFKRWSDKICIDPYSNPYYRFCQNL